MNVRLMESQVKKPATVVRLENQLVEKGKDKGIHQISSIGYYSADLLENLL